MARILSADLTTAQKGSSKTPYKRIIINAVDYSARVLYIEQHEEAYRDHATILLRNDDRLFDDVDLEGYKFMIGHGHKTSATPATWAGTTAYVVGDSVRPVTPTGIRFYCIVAGTSAGSEPTWPSIGSTVVDGTVTWEYGTAEANEYANTAPVWVKSQEVQDIEGESVCQLYCEGQWMYLREQRYLAKGDAPDFSDTITGITIYDQIEDVIEDELGWTLDPAPSPDEGILTTLTPSVKVNADTYEMVASYLYDLIFITETFLRAKANHIWDMLYPQSSDSVDHTYYSYQIYYFKKYVEKSHITTPNHIVVYANQSADGTWGAIITGNGYDTDQWTLNGSWVYTGTYVAVTEIFRDGSLTTQGDADNRADAIMSKIKSGHHDIPGPLSGYVIVSHDAGVELYDRVQVLSSRGL